MRSRTPGFLTSLGVKKVQRVYSGGVNSVSPLSRRPKDIKKVRIIGSGFRGFSTTKDFSEKIIKAVARGSIYKRAPFHLALSSDGRFFQSLSLHDYFEGKDEIVLMLLTEPDGRTFTQPEAMALSYLRKFFSGEGLQIVGEPAYTEFYTKCIQQRTVKEKKSRTKLFEEVWNLHIPPASVWNAPNLKNLLRDLFVLTEPHELIPKKPGAGEIIRTRDSEGAECIIEP